MNDYNVGYSVGDRVHVESSRIGNGKATVTAVYPESFGLVRYHVNFDRHPAWAHFSAYDYELEPIMAKELKMSANKTMNEFTGKTEHVAKEIGSMARVVSDQTGWDNGPVRSIIVNNRDFPQVKEAMVTKGFEWAGPWAISKRFQEGIVCVYGR